MLLTLFLAIVTCAVITIMAQWHILSEKNNKLL